MAVKYRLVVWDAGKRGLRKIETGYRVLQIGVFN